ncbi:hypothetical protein BGZ46_008549 [Entomortierella lignicola]|nr:hypothetical protein BGZ46_008549 [Entomortierella lignicola]
MTLQVVRDIDNTGRCLTALSNINFYTNFTIGSKLQFHPSALKNHDIPSFASWINPQEWAQLFLDPLSQLLEQHPSLSIVIGDSSGAIPKYLRLGSVDILRSIRVAPISTSAKVEEILKHEHNLSFDLSDHTSPLWRLVVAPITEEPLSFYIFIVFHHSIFDGRSGVIVSEQLIEKLNLQLKRSNITAITKSEQSTRIAITSSKPIPVPLEERVNCKPSLRTIVSQVAKEVLAPGFIKRAFETKYWAGEVDSARDTPIVTELMLLQLTAEESSKIILASKRLSTTVTAMIVAASAFAIKSVFMSEDENRHDAIKFGTTVSVRDLVTNQVAQTELGNYVLQAPHEFIQVDDESEFRGIAHQYRKNIVKYTSKEAIQATFEGFGMMEFLPKKEGIMEQYFYNNISKLQHGFETSLLISSVGRGWNQFKTASIGDEPLSDDEFLVKGAILSGCASRANGPIGVSVVTASGVMSIVVTWLEAAFKEKARGELLAAEFKRILLEASEEGNEVYLFRDVKRA